MILAGHGGPGLITHAFKCRRLSPTAGRREMSKVRTPTLPGVKMEGAGDPPPSVQLDPSSNRMIQKAHSSSEPPAREVAGPHLDFGFMRPWAKNPVNYAVPRSSTHRNWDKKWVWFSASKFVVICHGSNWKGIHFLRKKAIWNAGC